MPQSRRRKQRKFLAIFSVFECAWRTLWFSFCPCPPRRRNISAMKKLPAFLLLLVIVLPALTAVFLLADEQPKVPPMPGAVSSNAVASLKNGIEIYSVMGVGPRKTWDDITNKMYVLRLSSKKWIEGR